MDDVIKNLVVRTFAELLAISPEMIKSGVRYVSDEDVFYLYDTDGVWRRKEERKKNERRRLILP